MGKMGGLEDQTRTAEQVQRGHDALERDDLATAASIASELLASLPGHAPSQHLAGLVAFKQGRLETAVEHFAAAIGHGSNVPAYYVHLGAALGSLQRFREAAACFRQALALDPHDAETYFNLAAALRALGDKRGNIDHLRTALRFRPTYVEALFNLANALRDGGNVEESIALYRRAIDVRPDYAKALVNLGNLLVRIGRGDEAVPLLERATALRGGSSGALRSLAAAYKDVGRVPDAVDAARRAVVAAPQSAETHLALAGVLEEHGLLGDALASYRQAVRLAPEHAAALQRLGCCLLSAGRAEPAVDCFERVCELEPGNAAAQNNIGIVRLRQGRWAEAEHHLRRAVELSPDSADARTNLGTAYQEQGRFVEALDAYDTVLAASEDFADAHWNRALLRLRHGDYVQGWTGYEWRWQRTAYVASEFRRPPNSVSFPTRFGRRPSRCADVPLWNGEPLDGKPVLFFAEQGLGDTLQFVRFLAAAKRRGAHIVLECQRPLVPLLRNCPYIDVVVGQGDELPPIELQLPLLSVPHLLGASQADLSGDVPYLQAEPQLVERWRTAVNRLSGIRIGVAWQGNPAYAADRHRSLPLANFAPLAKLPKVQLVSLQRKIGLDQIANVRNWFEVQELGADVDAANGAFMDTAAILTHLDLVVTSDSALPHLAGALGVPTWLVLPHVCDWRWGTESDVTPWYPSMKLFRQYQAGDWAKVFRRVAAAAQERFALA